MMDPMNHDGYRYEMVADCRLRAATDLLAHTWDPVILSALDTGPRRRTDLRTAIGGISDKALTEALRRLLTGASSSAANTPRRHPASSTRSPHWAARSSTAPCAPSPAGSPITATPLAAAMDDERPALRG